MASRGPVEALALILGQLHIQRVQGLVEPADAGGADDGDDRRVTAEQSGRHDLTPGPAGRAPASVVSTISSRFSRVAGRRPITSSLSPPWAPSS